MAPFDQQALFANGVVRCVVGNSPQAGPFAAAIAWQGNVTFGPGVTSKGKSGIIDDNDILGDNKILPIPLENVTVKGTSVLLLSVSLPEGP